MKLPTDSKTRTQLAALAGFGLLAIAVLLYMGLASLLTRRTELRAKLDAARAELARIDREIKALPALRESRDDLFWTIQHAASNHILFHEYRNYHITAREQLLPMAAELAIPLDIPREGAIVDLPIPPPPVATNKPGARPAAVRRKPAEAPVSPFFALYTASMNGRASFDQLLALLRRMEERNPYLTLAQLEITDDPEVPDVHAFSMTLLWPVWKNLDQKPKPQDLIYPAPANALPLSP